MTPTKSTDEEGRQHDHRPGRPTVGQQGRAHHGEGQDRADREVDAGRDDDDELAQGQHLVEGRLAEDVEDVALGQEDVGLGQPGEDGHDEDHQEDAPAVEPADGADGPHRARADVADVRPGPRAHRVGHALIPQLRSRPDGTSEPLLLPMIQPMTSLRSISDERRVGEVAAVEEGHDAVADVEDVVQAMADEDDADAVRAQVLDEVEDLAHLAHGQRRCRLVHDDDLGFEGRGTGDGDSLALTTGQLLDPLGHGLDLDVQIVEVLDGPLLVGLVVHDVEGSDASGQLAAQEDVLVDAQVPRQGQVLVDHLDTQHTGVGRAVETDWMALHEDLARARRVESGEALHERRLARAVVANDSEDLTALEGQADVAERHDLPEPLRDAAGLDDGCLSPRGGPRYGRRRLCRGGSRGHAVISASPTGRCSAADTVRASAMRSASTPSLAVHGLVRVPRATSRKAMSSSR